MLNIAVIGCGIAGPAAALFLHGMSPQLGQGANLGLLDAQVLFECMSQYPVKKALEIYSDPNSNSIKLQAVS